MEQVTINKQGTETLKVVQMVEDLEFMGWELDRLDRFIKLKQGKRYKLPLWVAEELQSQGLCYSLEVVK